MKRRAIYIIQPLFLLLVMLPVIAVCLLQYRQLASEHNGKERLEKEHLQTVSLPEGAIRWAKPGKEIWVNNHLFDIKSFHLENGIYTFRGLFDEDETRIVKEIKQQEKQQTNSNNRLLGQLFKLLNAVYYTQGEENGFSGTDHAVYYPDHAAPLAFLFTPVNTPPPKA